jgi:hypothetical protein
MFSFPAENSTVTWLSYDIWFSPKEQYIFFDDDVAKRKRKFLIDFNLIFLLN